MLTLQTWGQISILDFTCLYLVRYSNSSPVFPSLVWHRASLKGHFYRASAAAYFSFSFSPPVKPDTISAMAMLCFGSMSSAASHDHPQTIHKESIAPALCLRQEGGRRRRALLLLPPLCHHICALLQSTELSLELTFFAWSHHYVYLHN